MPIAFVGANSVLNSTSGQSTALPMPAGIAAGHLLFALVASVGASPTATPPAGWSLVASFSPGSTLTSWLYRKVATAGDVGATATWTWSSQGRNLGLSTAYSGVDTAATSNAAQAHSTDGNLAVAAPSLGANAGDWLVTIGVGRENPGTATTKNWTVNVGTDAERLDVATGGAATDVKVSAAWFDSDGGVASGSTARNVSSTPDMGQRHVWSLLLPLPAGEQVGGNPWSHLGRPLR